MQVKIERRTSSKLQETSCGLNGGSPKMPAAEPKGRALSLENMNTRVWFYSFLLSLQYGAQPLISKRFIRYFTLVAHFCYFNTMIRVIIIEELYIFVAFVCFSFFIFGFKVLDFLLNCKAGKVRSCEFLSIGI